MTETFTIISCVFGTYIASSHCLMQCCSMPELLIPKSGSVPLGQPPHITASTLLDIHSALSISVTSNFIFCLRMNESWNACLFHLAYFIWHSDLFFSFNIMGFHPFCGCVLCSVPLYNILQFSFPFMQCFISWLLWTVMQYTSTDVSLMNWLCFLCFCGLQWN